MQIQADNVIKGGTFERPTPDEIAFCVREVRDYLGWKQLYLALEAGVDERAVQRIEAAKKVSDDSLRQVAKALNLREEAFVEATYCPPAQELLAMAQCAREQYLTTELREFSSARDFENVLTAEAFLVDDQAVDDAVVEEVARLKDDIQDWLNIYGDLQYTEKLQACRDLLATVRGIESHGYAARWTRYLSEDKFQVGIVVFLRKDGLRKRGPKLAMVPRRVLERGSL